MAVRVALWALPTAPVLAVKFAELWPIAMVTFAGTVTSALLLLSVTTAAEVAALVRDAVQVLDEFPPSVDGVQLSDVN